MYLPTLLLVGLTAACLCAEPTNLPAHPPGTSGTVLTAGRLDIPLQPVLGAFYIPEGQCSGHLHSTHYACSTPAVALQVTALSDVPPKIELVEGLEGGVHVFGCGPVVVTLAHACLLQENSVEDHFTPLPPLDSELVPDPALARASDPVPGFRRAPDVPCPLCKVTKNPPPKKNTPPY